MLDIRLTSKKNFIHVIVRAGKIIAALTSMMPNIGGHKPLSRLLLGRVYSYILLHGAPVWKKALSAEVYGMVQCHLAQFLMGHRG